MLDFENQALSSSSHRVQDWLDSLYGHHSSQSDEDRKIFEKSSMTPDHSTKSSTKISTRNSRKSSLSSASSLASQNVRRVHLRRPRYLVRRWSRKANRKAARKNSDPDQSSSYLSNSSADESNLFSNMSTLNFLNEDSQMPEIRADDLDFESRNSLKSIGSSCTNYSNHNHSFGVLDFERWNSDLQLGDELTLKVKTYAFAKKDIKIKLKGNTLVVSGKQSTEEENGYFKREFKKKFDLPYNSDKKNIKYDFDMNDHLIITVPRTIHSVH